MKKKINPQVALVCLALLVVVFSCKCNGKDTEKPERTSSDSLYFNKLVLTGSQYDSLKSDGATKLVFQFYYKGNGSCESPTLYAYAMKAMNQATVAKPQTLTSDIVTTEPFTGRAQVLGDQQIRIASLDSLLNEIPGGTKSKNVRFVFTPKFQPDNPHVYYDVEAEDNGITSGRSARTNPSPPASAF